MTTYRVVQFGDAAEAGNYPLPPYTADWEDACAWDGEYDYGIWRFEGDTPVEFIGCDGGAPEDQTLQRDWSWVAPALEAAFALGAAGEGAEA